ncbi:hypothetical protein J0910_00430 [Nocardiopsis sp. CNT-189]|uniref:hypothetical protein n=1 Tax=Nocardiopsis oceanisediminis TaxID=2816862 RepID=UPI003B2B2361
MRDDMSREWLAELHEFLHGSESVPVTRLIKGSGFALGLAWSAPCYKSTRSAIPDARLLVAKAAAVNACCIAASLAAFAFSRLGYDWGPAAGIITGAVGTVVALCSLRYSLWGLRVIRKREEIISLFKGLQALRDDTDTLEASVSAIDRRHANGEVSENESVECAQLAYKVLLSQRLRFRVNSELVAIVEDQFLWELSKRPRIIFWKR